MKPTAVTRELLHQLYTIEGKSQKEIAKFFNLSRSVISYHFGKHDIPYHHDKRIFVANDNFFDRWSSDMAYILGFIICDGNISPNNLIRIEIQKKDIEILEYIRLHLCPSQDIKFRNRCDKRTGNTYEMCLFYITSKKMCERLKCLGVVPNKTGKETCPKNIPKEYVGDFLRGLLDGDGSIHHKKITINQTTYSHFVFSICSSSKEFLCEINQHYMGGVGKLHTSKKIHTINIQNRKEIGLILSKIYNGNFRLERKYQKYLDFLKLCDDMKDNKISQGTIKGIFNKKIQHNYTIFSSISKE